MCFGSTGTLIFVLPNLVLNGATQISSDSTVIYWYHIYTVPLKFMQLMELAGIDWEK